MKNFAGCGASWHESAKNETTSDAVAMRRFGALRIGGLSRIEKDQVRVGRRD